MNARNSIICHLDILFFLLFFLTATNFISEKEGNKFLKKQYTAGLLIAKEHGHATGVSFSLITDIHNRHRISLFLMYKVNDDSERSDFLVSNSSDLGK